MYVYSSSSKLQDKNKFHLTKAHLQIKTQDCSTTIIS